MSVQMKKKTVDRQTFLNYTGLFILMFTVIYSTFFIQGKTFIWNGDGFHQHYPFFREYLTIIRNFLQTGHWQSWDWNIGLGADTLLTYGYYVVGDPFVYLGLLFPKGSEEFAFHFIMLVRIWCVGASFLFYARKMSLSHHSALLGSLMYAFSHNVIYNVVRHPFFIHPMIFFPLLALGIEKIFNKESGVFFILMVALSAASNFYFFYMLTWMIFLYALVRYTRVVKGKTWIDFFKWFSYFVGLYLIGLLISSGIFVPLVYGFLNASRSPSFPPISLFFYPLTYYRSLIINSITPGTVFWTVGGLSILGVFSLPFLFRRRQQRPDLFWFFLILGVLLLFPIFGSIMNGFSGPYNRFTFVLPFYVALSTAFFIDHQREMTSKDLRWINYLMVGFSVIYIVVSLKTSDYVLYLTPVILGWIIYGVIYAHYKNKLNPLHFQRTMIGFVMLNMVVNALIFYLPIGKNAMSATEDYGTIDKTYANVFKGVEQNLPEDELYRIGVTSHNNHVRNQYAYINKPGMNSYASLSNGAVADFAQFLEASSYQIIQPLRNGVDDRRVVNQALGVKYILTDEENINYLPSDYMVNSDLSDGETGMIVAETENEAPFAYIETEALSHSEAEKLHPVQRESLLAEAVILEDESTLKLHEADIPSLAKHEGIWERAENIHGQESLPLNEPMEITVDKDKSQMTLTFERPEDLVGQEVFLYFEGIEFDPPETPFWLEPSTSFRIRAAYNDQEKSVLQSDRYSFSSYFKRENILIHLNEVDTAEETLTVEFQNAGNYSFENVSVISRPFDKDIASIRAQEKNEQALEIESFSDKQIEGSVTALEDGMLVTNIPYTSGWKAYVDGQEVPTEKVNIGFVGVPISVGEHTIEFIYQTPLFKVGIFMTIVGLLALIGYGIFYRRQFQNKEDY